jgi:D-alanyl-lipoteichoic acid acyltransferase DltB (MBOAT superfamily)
VLFPTIRFAMFFAVVMPASWLLMPIPGRAARRGRGSEPDHAQPWVEAFGMIALAAWLGPLHPGTGWLASVLDVVGATPPHGLATFANFVCWAAAVALFVLGVRRWIDLRSLTRWNVFMLVASYVFYGAYSWHFVLLLMASTVVNQVLASAIDRTQQERGRRILLIAAVVANLGVLFAFKYVVFTMVALRDQGILGWFGLHYTPPASALIPPVGISFFTFQALSYVIDTYRRKLRPVPILEFAVYLSFFPHVVAGPIVRAAEFLPQLRKPRDARKVDTGLAFWLIAVGLFKKVVVSSYLASAAVDDVFRLPAHHQSIDTLIGIYAYAIQIYCDFSGYTDMAIGLALLIGFRFPQNFDAPYTATSLQDFWRRWHMTLSRWLRDYLYIPMGGNQGSATWGFCTLFLTMLIGGIWHGAGWTFIIWGALHGGWLVIERLWFQVRPVERVRTRVAERALVNAGSEGADLDLGMGDVVVGDHEGDLDTVEAEEAEIVSPGFHLSPGARLWLGRIVTFHVVCLGWVFFRATSFANARTVLGQLLFHFGTGKGVNLVVVGTIAFFLATQFVPTGVVGRLQATFSSWQAWKQGVVLAFWITFTSALSPTGVAPFIYFSF